MRVYGHEAHQKKKIQFNLIHMEMLYFYYVFEISKVRVNIRIAGLHFQ